MPQDRIIQTSFTNGRTDGSTGLAVIALTESGKLWLLTYNQSSPEPQDWVPIKLPPGCEPPPGPFGPCVARLTSFVGPSDKLPAPTPASGVQAGDTGPAEKPPGPAPKPNQLRPSFKFPDNSPVSFRAEDMRATLGFWPPISPAMHPATPAELKAREVLKSLSPDAATHLLFSEANGIADRLLTATDLVDMASFIPAFESLVTKLEQVAIMFGFPGQHFQPDRTAPGPDPMAEAAAMDADEEQPVPESVERVVERERLHKAALSLCQTALGHPMTCICDACSAAVNVFGLLPDMPPDLAERMRSKQAQHDASVAF